jgi:hypothetical protein
MNRSLVELLLKERMTRDIFFGQIIVLDSVKATKGLPGHLERRSLIVLSSRCMECMYFWSRMLVWYLIRPRMGWDWLLPLTRFSEFLAPNGERASSLTMAFDREL